MAAQRTRIHLSAGQPHRPDQPHSPLHKAGLRRIRFHDLRNSIATLHVGRGVDVVVIKELLAHVRLHLQGYAIDTFILGYEDPNSPPATATVR